MEAVSNKRPLRPLPSVNDANEFIEQQLDGRIREIENDFGADAISLNGPILFGVDDLVRKAIEKKFHEDPPRTRLAMLLTTGGGVIEVVPKDRRHAKAPLRRCRFYCPKLCVFSWNCSGDVRRRNSHGLVFQAGTN